jgi:diaminohydroxyphosphoribosylaminopyrimidine deaminase / 5-amino-6-(5-phosphoribosylamino)uracil reductase
MTPDTALTLEDLAHLARSVEIARRGWGRVSPNPMVGCVLVRAGEVIAEGYHEVYGGPHAEVVALERALLAADGSTAYVSLEPCNHHGRTPPCSQALIDAGVKRVVYAASDPGEKSGGGAVALQKAGLSVVGPVGSRADARAENPAFFHAARHSTPFVALKLAMSLDGMIATAPGVSTRITGADAEREVHRLRTGFDAVLVGAGTVRADDPRLTVRLVPPGSTAPRRLMLLPDANLPADAGLLQEVEDAPVHVFCGVDASEVAIKRLDAAGVHVHPVPADETGLRLESVLAVCQELGIQSILCEGGSALGAALLRENLVGRLYLWIAPHVIGQNGLPAFAEGLEQLDWNAYAPSTEPELFGLDTLIVLDRKEDG